MTAPMGSTPPLVSVVVATYNRADSVARLLAQLAGQTLPPDRFEVVVVDDGSTPPVGDRLTALCVPYGLLVLAQQNAGPAAARHAAILRSRGDVIVIVDDDMSIAPDFLTQHLAEHPRGSRRVVLGWVRADPGTRLRLFERFQLVAIERLVADVRAGRAHPRGSNLYTGNVSFRRDDYLAVGGFDPTFRLSEDSELGIRLERAGATVAVCDRAVALHASDHTSVSAWMRRGKEYGAADLRVSEKHPDLVSADPWRFFFAVSPISRPLLLGSALAPSLLRPAAQLAMWSGIALDKLGAERLALAATTFVYGVQYYAGVRVQAGSRRRVLAGLRRYLNRVRSEELPPMGRIAKFVADVRADHDAIRRADAKYQSTPRSPVLMVSLVQRIGYQIMVAYRVMRLFRDLRLTLVAKATSRYIRHFYAADIHWDADLAPGTIIVHGVGLVVSHSARVGPGCVLFQHVTLGESISRETREVGAPTLESDVHVGPGASLLGPITVGRGSKVMAGVVLMDSVPAYSLVEGPAPVVRVRSSGGTS